MEKVLHLNDREIVLYGDNFENIDLQKILVIDYDNLAEEVANFPYVLNQVNSLFVEAEDILRRENFALEVLKDNLSDLKSRLSFSVIEIIKVKGIKTPTIQNIEDEMSQNEEIKTLKSQIQAKKKDIIDVTLNRDNLQGLFWSCKAKMDTIINLSNKLTL